MGVRCELHRSSVIPPIVLAVAERRRSKREIRDARRFRADEARRLERARRARLNMLVIGGAIALGAVLLALVALSIHRRGNPAPAVTPSTAPATSATPLPARTAPATTSAPTSARGTATSTGTRPATPSPSRT